jgi:hypothetical protein
MIGYRGLWIFFDRKTPSRIKKHSKKGVQIIPK